jgi:hypothetical protein
MYRAYTSLSATAAIAYAALRDLMHPGEHRVSALEYEESMALIAAHIALVVPVFGKRSEDDDLSEISRAEIAEGHFRWGALRLDFGDGRAPYLHLAIRKSDVDPIMERLRAAYAPVRRPSAHGAASIRQLMQKVKE